MRRNAGGSEYGNHGRSRTSAEQHAKNSSIKQRRRLQSTMAATGPQSTGYCTVMQLKVANSLAP